MLAFAGGLLLGALAVRLIWLNDERSPPRDLSVTYRAFTCRAVRPQPHPCGEVIVGIGDGTVIRSGNPYEAPCEYRHRLTDAERVIVFRAARELWRRGNRLGPKGGDVPMRSADGVWEVSTSSDERFTSLEVKRLDYGGDPDPVIAEARTLVLRFVRCEVPAVSP